MPISPLWSVTFLSTPSARRATAAGSQSDAAPSYFYPRPPRGGRPEILGLTGTANLISIHALREEGDYTLMSGLAQLTYFYPRPPRGGRPEPQLLYCNYCTISIHALREEGDYSPTTPTTKPRNFYPRPPRGGRLSYEALSIQMAQFLSTPSARRATQSSSGGAAGGAISIHALREEGDANGNTIYDGVEVFLSTPSARRATSAAVAQAVEEYNFYPRPPRGGRPPRCRWFSWVRGISIHALREEGDNKPKTDATRVLPFLSTPSARRATSLVNSNLDLFLFLSTPSARRATPQDRRDQGRRLISIHALREEGDLDTK